MSNRRVLVTGSSSGFGRAMVPAFLERGWHVIATMRRANERATVFSEEMRTYGDRLQIISLDITNSTERDALRQRLDRLDCLVHNAGYGLAGPLEETPESEFRREMETNFTAPAILTQSLLPLLRASRGRLIFISSSLGLAGFPLHSVYCASKFALEGLAESLSYELAPHGVQVALVEPGAHRTQFGANIVWVETSKGSPYGTQTTALKRLRDRMLARQGVPPDGVVRQVIDLAEARRMKFRSQAGMDAKGLYAFRKFAPTWMAQRTFQIFFHRLLGGAAG